MKTIYLPILILLMACTNATIPSEPKFLQKHLSSHKPAGKSRGYFHIAMESKPTDDDILELSAVIKATQDFSPTTLEWQIPPHIEIVDGEKSQTTSFTAGESKTVAIKLRTSTIQKGDAIFVFSYKIQDGERYGASSNYVHETTKPVQRKSELETKSQKNPKIIQ